MADHYLVTTTAPDRETAVHLAGSAVRAKLAATAQVHSPVTSFWWHLGSQGEGAEWLATFKTTSTRYPELERPAKFGPAAAGHDVNLPLIYPVHPARFGSDLARRGKDRRAARRAPTPITPLQRHGCRCHVVCRDQRLTLLRPVRERMTSGTCVGLILSSAVLRSL
jgi:uncharacterized protein involved in tolerance to divalent cations